VTAGSGAADGRRPSISVVICAYTLARWADLARAVESVTAQTRAPLETIVVIDNNDELEARARAQFAGVLVVANAHEPGLSGGRRTGSERARGDVIAFLDDDAVADPDWLEQLAAVYEDPFVLGAGGLIEPLWAAPPPRWFPAEFNWVVGCTYAGMPVARGRVRNAIGANMSVRASVLARTGAFDPRLGRSPGGGPVHGTAEETEFCIRASQAHPGRYWIYEPRARVRHTVPPERASFAYFTRRCVVEGTAKAQLARYAGAGEGLRTEREYTRSVLPRALSRNLLAGMRGEPGGFARAGAIVAGLAITAAAYGRSRARLRANAAGSRGP
jgi:cellulose synthase/poly-beta-1,6-N-acetylglucosamine synthase-like glycosyltransferase